MTTPPPCRDSRLVAPSVTLVCTRARDHLGLHARTGGELMWDQYGNLYSQTTGRCIRLAGNQP